MDPIEQQMRNALEKLEERHHAIMLGYKSAISVRVKCSPTKMAISSTMQMGTKTTQKRKQTK